MHGNLTPLFQARTPTPAPQGVRSPFDISNPIPYDANLMIGWHSMASKAKTHASTRQRASSASQPEIRPSAVPETDHLLTWFKDFDARLAELTARQHVLLKSLGVEPAPHREPAERLPNA